MPNYAYDNILEYSSTDQFGELRRSLIGKRGTIASGNLVSGMFLKFDQRGSSNNETLFEDFDQDKTPVGIFQRTTHQGTPGLIFNKYGYQEVLRQVESRGEIDLSSITDKLEFLKTSDMEAWERSSDTVKRRCLTLNLEKLNKETATQYRTHGDRAHYLTIGMVEVTTYKDIVERHPLYLFPCSSLNIKSLKASIEKSGFINFWLDKNIFDGEIGKQRGNNYDINLDSNFSSEVNTVSQYMSSINLTSEYKSINIIPTYMAFQIITGLEAEYVDPAWAKILGESKND